jgi:hypothetical protein
MSLPKEKMATQNLQMGELHASNLTESRKAGNEYRG